MPLVAGIDSSTQSCKVVVRDAGSGALRREGRAKHPEGTEIDPERWWAALRTAVADAGGLDGVEAIAVGGQQHGMVALDAEGRVIRPALLWHDTRSASAATDLINELGAEEWARSTGLVPVASFTVTKLRWLAEHEPDNADRVAAVALPHDWLTWRLAGFGPDNPDLAALVTDRSDASGTGYWSPIDEDYRRDLLVRALGHDCVLPRVVAPNGTAGTAAYGSNHRALLGPGAGDNAAAALGLGMREGDVAISIGTSGVVSAVSAHPVADVTGTVAGFADATGQFLPLAVTLNGARVLDAAARLLGVDHGGLADLALAAPAGAGGLVLVPYLEGERTPNKPTSTGAFHGLTLATSTPAHLARAAVEGLLNGLSDGLAGLTALGTRVDTVSLIGGGARSEAVRRCATSVFGMDISVPAPGEYVADGAARQAAWALSGASEPPTWERPGSASYAASPADLAATAGIRDRYAEARDLTVSRP
ncbi:MAG: xylulokinase [Nostocoides sp.]